MSLNRLLRQQLADMMRRLNAHYELTSRIERRSTMTKDEKPTPVVHCPPDDPLGIDPDKDFQAEVRRIARDAIEGRHKEAVQAELDAIRRKYPGWLKGKSKS
ncbi:hypothetical protein NKY66_10705 [Sinorhizobium meliloti]|uniref:hypothetical protein n=1 Tax=Rhizobium meliloti TaxID=382 RepID=UPI003D6512A4